MESKREWREIYCPYSGGPSVVEACTQLSTEGWNVCFVVACGVNMADVRVIAMRETPEPRIEAW